MTAASGFSPSASWSRPAGAHEELGAKESVARRVYNKGDLPPKVWSVFWAWPLRGPD